MIKKLKRLLILVIFVLLFILYFINSNYIIENIINYTILFLTKLAPASFLFFTFSSLFLELHLLDYLSKLFKINTNTYLLLLSSLSGFPSGAKYTKELYNLNYFEQKEANNALLYTHFPNPLFIFSSISTLLNNSSLPLKLYLSIILSNLLLFITFKGKNKKEERIIINNKSFSSILTSNLNNTFHILLIIYGTSLFFYLIPTIITKYISFNSNIYIIMNGLFDLTKGIFSTSIISNNILRSYYILLFLSFGSISIHMQTSTILEDTNLSYLSFLKGRILGTIISIIIFTILI